MAPPLPCVIPYNNADIMMPTFSAVYRHLHVLSGLAIGALVTDSDNAWAALV